MSSDVRQLTLYLGQAETNAEAWFNIALPSTETRRLVRTDSPGRPPRLSHSSWTMLLLKSSYQSWVPAILRHEWRELASDWLNCTGKPITCYDTEVGLFDDVKGNWCCDCGSAKQKLWEPCYSLGEKNNSVGCTKTEARTDVLLGWQILFVFPLKNLPNFRHFDDVVLNLCIHSYLFFFFFYISFFLSVFFFASFFFYFYLCRIFLAQDNFLSKALVFPCVLSYRLDVCDRKLAKLLLDKWKKRFLMLLFWLIGVVYRNHTFKYSAKYYLFA